MKKLISIILLFLALPAHAQVSGGGQIFCKNPAGNTRTVACDTNGNIGAGASTVAAQFAAMDVTVPGGIGAAYADVLDLPDGTKMVLFDNQTNGDVDISLDGGVSTHYSLKGGDTLALNLAQFGLITTVHVWVKDGTTASTAGAFNISSFK